MGQPGRYRASSPNGGLLRSRGKYRVLMSRGSFINPLLSVSADGQVELPVAPGETAAYADPHKALQAWHRVGASHIFLSGPSLPAVKSPHNVTVIGATTLSGPDQVSQLLGNGYTGVVVDRVEAAGWLGEAVKTHRDRVIVRLHVHEAWLSAHVQAGDGSDLWTVVEQLDGMGVHNILVSTDDHGGRWHHKSLEILAGVAESTKAGVLAWSPHTSLEQLHKVAELSQDGVGGVVAGFDATFTFAEAVSAISARYDPYIWAPPTVDPDSGLGQV